MNFLGAVVGFLSTIWITFYILTIIANNLLGIAAIGVIGMGFYLLITAVTKFSRQDSGMTPTAWAGGFMFVLAFLVAFIDHIFNASTWVA